MKIDKKYLAGCARDLLEVLAEEELTTWSDLEKALGKSFTANDQYEVTIG